MSLPQRRYLPTPFPIQKDPLNPLRYIPSNALTTVAFSALSSTLYLKFTNNTTSVFSVDRICTNVVFEALAWLLDGCNDHWNIQCAQILTDSSIDSDPITSLFCRY